MSNKQEKDKLVNRYLEKFEQIPIIRNYPSEDTPDKKLHKKIYGTFTNEKGLECDVLIEFYEEQPAYCIYYGCFVSKYEEGIESEWEQVSLSVKHDFTLYWGSAQKANNKILEFDYLDESGYWPFWIRLEDNEDVYEAIKNVHIIINSLLSLGFKCK